MKELYLVCFYCGKEWTKTVYTYSDMAKYECPRCNDKRIKVKPIEKKDVYGYNYKREDRE